MRRLWRATRAIGRFLTSLPVGQDPAGDRLVAGDHAEHLHAGTYSTPRPARRRNHRRSTSA